MIIITIIIIFTLCLKSPYGGAPINVCMYACMYEAKTLYTIGISKN